MPRPTVRHMGPADEPVCIESATDESGYAVPFVRHPGTAACVCVRANEILLIQQHRPALGRRILEVPGGVIKLGETARAAAVRELFEEAGVRGIKFQLKARIYSSVGITNELIHLFSATIPRAPLSPEHGARAKWFPLPKAQQMIREGKIRDGKTVLAILLARRKL